MLLLSTGDGYNVIAKQDLKRTGTQINRDFISNGKIQQSSGNIEGKTIASRNISDSQNLLSTLRTLRTFTRLKKKSKARSSGQIIDLFNFKVKMKMKRGKRRSYRYPTNRREILLYSRTGYLLEILPRGRIKGTTNASSLYGKFISFLFLCSYFRHHEKLFPRSQFHNFSFETAGLECSEGCSNYLL